MKVRPLTLDDCPSVSQSDVRATLAALRLISGVPERWSFEAPPLGQGSAAIVGIGSTASDLGPDALTLSLVTSVECGRLELDGVFASLLVDAALRGRGVRTTVRCLGPAEQGLVVGLLGKAFELIGWTLRLGPAPRLYGDEMTIVVRLAFPFVGTGVVHLRLPETVSAPFSPVTEERRARRARVSAVARVEVAATELSAAAVIVLSVGDIVLFEPRQALPPAETWEALLVIGQGTDRFVAPVRIAADGMCTLENRFSRAPSPVTEAKVDTSDHAVIGSAPIEVVAELGRLTLRGDEVMGLAPGAVLAIGARRCQVTLRVGGQAWAEGEIVDVEGRLGVRVIKVLQG